MKCKWGDLISLEYGKPVKDKASLDGQVPVFGTNGKIGTSHLPPLCTNASFILGRKGAYRGVHYSDIPFSVIDTAFYAKNLTPNRLSLKWAYYMFLTYDINSMDSGSAIPSTDRYEIYSIEVDLPTLEDQLKAVNVLEALDNKIELNQKINENLERQADLIYDNIFGDETEFVELGTVVKTTSGGTPSRKHLELYENPSIYWVKSKELGGGFIHGTEEKINKSALSRSSAKMLPSHSVLVAMYGATVGEYGIIASSMACNQAVCALIPNTSYPYPYLYELMRHSKKQLKNMAVGSAQQNISQVLVKQLPVHASIHKVERFIETSTTIFYMLEHLTLENLRLALLRDILLPKLMSGEIDVL